MSTRTPQTLRAGDVVELNGRRLQLTHNADDESLFAVELSDTPGAYGPDVVVRGDDVRRVRFLRSAALPVTCTPWCETQDGHGDEHPDDQCCVATTSWVTTTLAPKWRGGSAWHPAQVQVLAERGPARPDAVVLNREDDVELALRPSEARALAAELHKAAALLDGQDDAEDGVR